VESQQGLTHIPADFKFSTARSWFYRIDGRIILRWIFRRWNVGVWTGLSWLWIETGGGHCECGNEPSGSIKCGEFLD
jgi:hypothetical protein